MRVPYNADGLVNRMSRILAVDYGTRRTGVARSDLTRTLCGDAVVLRETDEDRLCLAIADLCGDVGEIVVGLPRHMNGDEGEMAAQVRRFAAHLADTLPHIPVRLQDERLTSAQASRILVQNGQFGKKKRANLDAIAAALLLESVL